MNKTWLYITFFAIGFLVPISIFTFGHNFNSDDIEQRVYANGMKSKNFYDDAYASVSKDRSVRASALLSAHHLLIANRMAEVFHRVRSPWVRTVIVLSPNHFDAGRSPVQTTMGEFQTPYGDVKIEDKGVRKILTEMNVTLEPNTFDQEHGIYALMPFIKRSFPNARVIPIILHDSLSKETAEILGKSLAEQFPKAFLVASADISHYQPQYVTDYHDAVTKMALQNGAHGVSQGLDEIWHKL